MATQAVVPAEDRAATLAEWKAVGADIPDYEWADDGTGDVAPSFPLVKVVQGTSTMDGATKNVGRFFRTDTDEFFHPLLMVPLFQKNTRAFFRQGEDQPACRSDDGVAPAPNQPQWEGRPAPSACSECPLGMFGPNVEAPACKAGVVVLGDVAGELVQLRIPPSGISAWKRFVARRLKPKKLPLCSHEISVSTEERTEAGKKWQGIVIDSRMLRPSESAQYNAVLAYERTRFEEAVRNTDFDDDAPSPAPKQEWGDGRQSLRERLDIDADGVILDPGDEPIGAGQGSLLDTAGQLGKRVEPPGNH